MKAAARGKLRSAASIGEAHSNLPSQIVNAEGIEYATAQGKGYCALTNM